MSPFGIGIVGCGNIARVHAQAIQAISGSRLLGFCGKRREKAQEMAAEFKTGWTVELEQLLENPEIQAISICTPSGAHAEIGIQAAQAGKHIIVEKPIDVTRTKAMALIESCHKWGVKLAVIFQSRFLPSVQFIKRSIEDGRLGKIIAADAYVKWYRTPEYYEAAKWRGTLELDGGGALINQSIHTIDLLQFLAGRVDSVFGLTRRQLHQSIEAEDTAVAVVNFMDGAIGVIEGSTSIFPGFSRRLEIHGEKGSVILDGNEITYWKLKDDPGGASELEKLGSQDTSDGASNPMNLDIAGHRLQYEDFIESIEQGREPLVSGGEGLKALEIVLAIYRSSREGRLVKLDEIRRS
jgi:UDP-N-acetyl-2-amino-2-deoxyglucuronate dehydrogenase